MTDVIEHFNKELHDRLRWQGYRIEADKDGKPHLIHNRGRRIFKTIEDIWEHLWRKQSRDDDLAKEVLVFLMRHNTPYYDQIKVHGDLCLIQDYRMWVGRFDAEEYPTFARSLGGSLEHLVIAARRMVDVQTERDLPDNLSDSTVQLMHAVEQFDDFLPVKHYVTLYRHGQSYGGPEEGGWYYHYANPLYVATFTNAKDAMYALECAGDFLHQEEDMTAEHSTHAPHPSPLVRPHYC